MAGESGVSVGTDTSSARPLTEREHQLLVVEYNRSAAPYPSEKTIVELFEAQAARTPADEAIRFGDQSLTYGALNGRANQLAAHLRTLGVAKGHFVALYLEHSIDVVCAILGVLKAGAAYVPVDPASPRERLAFMLQDIVQGRSGALPVLVTQSDLLSRVPRGAAKLVTVDADAAAVGRQPASNPPRAASPSDLAYVIYTSGSTGKPKGVLIEHRSLVNYIWWAREKYCQGERLAWPLFSSLAFDLTVTSIFTPLVSGGRIVVYCDNAWAHGTVILTAVQDNQVDIIKLTPAHLTMIQDLDLSASRIRRLIVGGEDFKTELARAVTRKFGRPVEIYNEYGPTEATVGCMIHRYDVAEDLAPSVPIGTPAANAGIYVLDEQLRPVPPGVVGEMYLAGDGLARGYLDAPELTAQRFVTGEDPRRQAPSGTPSGASAATLRLYKTGDLARWTGDGRMEYLGRADFQVKIGGARVELGEIEARLLQHPDIRECVVTVFPSAAAKASEPVRHCERCGVASNLPGTSFDADGVCNWCRAYDSYADKAQAYFKSREEFKAIADQMKAARTGAYDCVALYSGGKDSSYMLYQLCELGLKPLVFSLDNGFISEEAKTNIRRVVEALGVDLVFGSTPHMNEIFVDSLKTFANVCNGCFKTIYTLAINVAREKGIKYIVTGLSRGQFFETRLTEDVFRRDDFDVVRLDALVLEARKAYHQRQDAVSCHVALDVLHGDGTLDDIQFVDFFRYWSVPLEELYATLHQHGTWSRPSDTGRSTNCLINDLGIYIHKKQRGFHNYSLPYSWDVRLGQKTRGEAMAELEDAIDEARVKEIMTQIGYTEPPEAAEPGVDRLVAYYVGDRPVTVHDLRAHVAEQLPEYMVPARFVRLDRLPLTSGGKVDRKALPAPSHDNPEPVRDVATPRTDTERAIAAIWTDLLMLESVGIHDDFFELGGRSLLAIQMIARLHSAFKVNVELKSLFESPTVAGLAGVVDQLVRGGA